MATYIPRSHSPRASDRVGPQTHSHIAAPITPVHSPHHSVTSSASSRTPIHTLSIHEYRRQQNTPTSQVTTSLGKTLRRKAAAPTLSGVQRDLTVRSSRPDFQSSFRPLHVSHSEQQLHSRVSPFQQQLVSDQILRSQSAEPRTLGGSISSISTTNTTGKIRYFNSRKRLPKPSTLSFHTFPSQLSAVGNNVLQSSLVPNALEFAAAGSRSSDARTAKTTSTFSLSRFPQPPHLLDPSPSPPHDESQPPRLNAPNFSSIAPETPPTTPATYHYRGASFDLVNPHDSLLLHDIVTPSRDFGSSEYSFVHAYEAPFEGSEEVCIYDPMVSTLTNRTQMAPKRALYGDFSAAHAGIMRRPDGSFSSSNLELPLPPTPAAISPSSSTYTSPLYSPESNLAPSPLAVKKPTNESRFSLKQLTRTLTKRLGKNSDKQHDRELQELRATSVHIASISMEGDFPRPLEETYVPTPQSAYFPLSPTSPITPTSPAFPREEGELYEDEHYPEVEMSRNQPLQRRDTEPLASMMPDEYSTQLGRAEDPRTSVSEGHLLSRPYYDDLDSIYPSSSIYTSDDRHKSNYQQSLAGTRQSNSFVRYSGMDAGSFDNEYNQDNMYEYSTSSHRQLKPLSQDMYIRSATQEKTDTISKIIDQYDPNTATSNTTSIQSQEPSDRDFPFGHDFTSSGQMLPVDHLRESKVTGLDRFNFSLNDKSKQFQGARLPPQAPPPLAPPFQYGERTFALPYPETSEMFPNDSCYSYGDTRNLLQISQTDGLALSIPGQYLQPSSSYSQQEAKSLEPSSSYSQAAGSQSPQTPQEALDQADRIFQSAVDDKAQTEKGIPAMWVKRSSGSLLLSKKITNQSQDDWQSSDLPTHSQVAGEINEADWESVDGNSRGVRDSLGSIADYSSSEGSRNSLSLGSNGSLPSWNGQNHSQGLSVYSHPSPIRAHDHPFGSSPPQLRPQTRLHSALESSSSPLASSPPISRTMSVLRLSTRSEERQEQNDVEPPYAIAPWANQYAFSDKETEELLASGPNEKIMFESERGSFDEPQEHYGVMAISSSPVSVFDGPRGLERENTFEKLCYVGPKGNLTGTPRGTGMHETGSSIADTSSPGQALVSSAIREGFHSPGYPGFYATPLPITSSVTHIEPSPPISEPELERSPSQVTLFPKSGELEPVIETSPVDESGPRSSLRHSQSLRAQRRISRTAVPGQTKLRQMILAPEAARKTLSSADTNFSRALNKSGRPSTSDTTAPLRPKLSVETLPIVRTLMVHQHSPHLLCPERAAVPEDEERRRKLSWAILAVFCLLPPCIILYRVWGDSIMVSLTKGHLGHCTPKSKKVALIAGITVNVGVAVAIVVPIVIAHALGAA
jgi:hypothetical protein